MYHVSTTSKECHRWNRILVFGAQLPFAPTVWYRLLQNVVTCSLSNPQAPAASRTLLPFVSGQPHTSRYFLTLHYGQHKVGAQAQGLAVEIMDDSQCQPIMREVIRLSRITNLYRSEKAPRTELQVEPSSHGKSFVCHSRQLHTSPY